MQNTLKLSNHKFTASGLLPVVVLLYVGVVLAGIPLPLIADPRASLVILAALGLLMCTRSEGQARRIASPDRGTALYAALGVLAGGLVLAALLNLSLPFIPDYRAAFLALAVVISLKVALVRAPKWFARGRV